VDRVRNCQSSAVDGCPAPVCGQNLGAILRGLSYTQTSRHGAHRLFEIASKYWNRGIKFRGSHFTGPPWANFVKFASNNPAISTACLGSPCEDLRSSQGQNARLSGSPSHSVANIDKRYLRTRAPRASQAGQASRLARLTKVGSTWPSAAPPAAPPARRSRRAAHSPPPRTAPPPCCRAAPSARSPSSQLR